MAFNNTIIEIKEKFPFLKLKNNLVKFFKKNKSKNCNFIDYKFKTNWFIFNLKQIFLHKFFVLDDNFLN